MKMLIVVALALISVSSVTAREEPMSLTGKLVFACSTVIRQLDLKSSTVEVLHRSMNNSYDNTEIYDIISKVDEDHFLFDETLRHTIRLFDRRTGRASVIREGSAPTYLPKHRKFFFYYSDPAMEPRGTRLYMAEFERPVESAKLIDQERHGSEAVIPISPDEVVYPQADDRDGNKVWYYHLVTGERRRLPLPDCMPKIWRSASQQLLCFDRPKQRHYLTDLRGEKVEYLPQLEDMIASTYIPKYDVLIGSIARFQLFPLKGEVYDIWAYDFKQERSVRLLTDAVAGLGSAAWFED